MPGNVAAGLPTGTVTFLFTDVAGSTGIWDQSAEAMRAAMLRHDDIIEEVVAQSGGVVVRPRGEGDSRFTVFDQAPAAVRAALRIGTALRAEGWPGMPRPLELRTALHTGTADVRDGDYYGPEVNRAARLRSAGHPGQILLSGATAALVRGALPARASLLDLGWHQLRDVAAAEQIFQLAHPELPQGFPPLVTVDRRHNVPPALTSFVGRRAETDEVKRLVSSSRLLTLTGSGGMGKSRLAYEVAAELLPEFPDDAFVVDLAPLSEPDLVPQQVLSALGVAEEPGRDHLDTIVGYVGNRRLLLLLDGGEHLVAACAALAEAVLRSCPNVRILVTSREPLLISGEVTWRVPSLTVPGPAGVSSSDDLAGFDAVQLFVDRALQSKPDFAVNAANAGAIVQVCDRLDGIPLAIELAATRVRVLSCEQIADRLKDRFHLLTGGARNALPRHQTLRAAVDWSFELLSEPERVLFRRLSVFPGGFSIEATEAICAGEGCDRYEILDELSHLVDKSLVVAEERAGRVRYRLLETLRAYAAERLVEAGEQVVLHTELVRWFKAEAERAEPELKGPDQGRFLDLLESEHDNLRLALGWALDHGDPGDGLALSVLLSRFWLVRGYLREGRRWLEQALAANSGAPPLERAKALIGASTLAWHQGDYGGVAPLAEEALTIAGEWGDKVAEAEALCRLGELATMTGDHAQARSRFEQSRDAWRESGAMRGVIQSLNVPLHDLGTLAVERGDYDEASALFEEALAIAERHGNTMEIVHHLSGLGHVAKMRGEPDVARSFYEESHAMALGLGYKRMVAFTLQYLAGLAWAQAEYVQAAGLYREALAYFGPARDVLGVARCLEGLAKIAAVTGHYERAGRVFGVAENLRETMQSPLPPSEASGYQRAVEHARAGAGDVAFDIARADGRRMELEAAVAYASGTTTPMGPTRGPSRHARP